MSFSADIRDIHVFFSDNIREILLCPIFHVEKPFFCCIFTSFAQIEKINIDLKPPFDGGDGKLMQSGTRRLYHGAVFYYRSNGGFQMMALLVARILYLLVRLFLLRLLLFCFVRPFNGQRRCSVLK